MPKVLNKRTDVIPRSAVYVGRPSKWGNPYKMQSPRDRLWVIRLFQAYCDAHPEFVAAVKRELRGKDLVCWCAPRACHADILLKIANE